MSQTAIIGVAVLAMVCCSSSSAAMLMMGGDDDTSSTRGPSSTGPAPPTEYKYEFIVEAPHHSSIGHHINDVLVDGVKPPEGSVVLYKDPDRNDTVASSIWDGDVGTQVNYNDTQAKGGKFMTITLNSRPQKFTIRYGRPRYAPGWLIKENGKEIIKETSNRGSESTPSPQSYDYVLP
jgi:hypothetical protein